MATHRKKNSLFSFALKKQTHRYDTTDVVKRVKKLLKGHEDLLDGFNCFLPDVSSKICVFFILSSLLLYNLSLFSSAQRRRRTHRLSPHKQQQAYKYGRHAVKSAQVRRFFCCVCVCVLSSRVCCVFVASFVRSRVCVCVCVHTFINRQTLSKQHRSKKKNRTSNERTRRKRSNKTNSNNIAKSKKRKRTRTNRR